MPIGLNGKERQNNSKSAENKNNRFADEEFADNLDDIDDPNNSEGNVKKVAVISAIVVFVVVLMFIFVPKILNSSSTSSDGNLSSAYVEDQTEVTSSEGSSEESTSDPTTSEGEGEEEEVQSFVDEEPDYANSDNNQAVGEPGDADDFVMNLTGQQVPADYIVKNRSYVKAYVNYELHRGVIDDGMEIYWIDVVYKKKSYRAQIPFYYAKDLSSEGICRVEMELLDLENGGQIISYMQVVSGDDGTE